MLVIRNRLIALLFRLCAFAVLLWSLISYWSTLPYAYTAFCLLEIQTGLAYLAALFLLIIFNAIDLRHGIHGAAAGGYMPAMLGIVAYTSIGGAVALGYSLPIHNLLNPSSILYSALLIALPIAEWLLFEYKGNVRYYHTITWTIYPVFFMVFSILRVLIWTDAPLFQDGRDFEFLFLDFFAEPVHWVYSVITVLVCYGWGVLLSFIDLAMGRKSREQSNLLQD